ncbi:MAG TPA: LysM peptidoglycan-binding domain-containing protein [Caldithrix abyssi]|uniref:LysM peptidoglycan-binding domain-containing protein n=1 Tax=Caldithrix abyssi TaxID=187145 RepID=A0A7V1LN16_CALAY|nr:LysM peptidoglycan-binding domain-containing protein [Caldithrix abyssi]
MKKSYYLITPVLILWIVLGCSTQKKMITPREEPVRYSFSLPDTLWLSETSLSMIDSMVYLERKSRIDLGEADSIAAQYSLEYMFEIASRFSDQDRETLSAWRYYDSLQTAADNRYRLLMSGLEKEATEAEEIREDITEIEERSFPDSILFGKVEYVDTSGSMPLTLNRKVRLAIKYFQTKGRPVFTKWLERSGKYEGMIREVLRNKNLPEELAYLAMIESGFNPRARSYARAVGMWQFISATGRYYGLRHNWWFDERRDIIKSTDAATDHLADLYERFGHWYLALAGYNCNPRRVEYNMRRYKTRDYWKLRRLPRQTRNYVPTFLAAAIIANDPEKFGFHVKKHPPIEVDTVLVSESIDLNVIARAVDTSYTYIKEINPAILRWVTPPGVKDFTLYLPKGKKEQFKERYKNIPDSEKRSWVRHKIRRGETLSTIAQKYHTSMSVLKKTNNLRGTMIRAGKYLLIPVPQNKAHFYAYKSPKKTKSKKWKKRTYSSVPQKENSAEYDKVVYEVKKGDTLGEIAEMYNTRASKIRRWNGLYYGQNIYPKQKLTIYVHKKSLTVNNVEEGKTEQEKGTFYTVRPGDTLWDISLKYGISIKQLKALNKKRSSRIRPGEKLKISNN